MEVKQRKKLFFSRCILKDKVCNLVIDRKYWINAASRYMVEKLKLPVLEHPTPYIIECLGDPEFKDIGDWMVTKQVLVPFKLGEYEDEVLCDVLPTETQDLLLGLPWRHERRAKHDMSTNKYSFLFENREITLVPLGSEKVMHVKSENEEKKMSLKEIERKESYEKEVKEKENLERKESEEKEVVEKENCERKKDGKEKNEVSIDKGESFEREEDEKSKLEKESGEKKGEFFLDNQLTYDAGLDLRANLLEEEENDANMGSLCILGKAYLDHVRVPIVLVPRASLKYFCDPQVAKLFIDFDCNSYYEVKNNEFEEARLVFDPGNLEWFHSWKKCCPKSIFLLEDYYEDLRTNLFEERENDVSMGALSMWKETYKETLKSTYKDIVDMEKLRDI